MVGKKGMSPIIATILLIAFAVALGAMIMNWSSSLVAGGAKEFACDKAKISLRTPLCFHDNYIRIDVTNTGSVQYGALMLGINSKDVHQEIKIKNSALGEGEILLKEIPSMKPKDATFTLIAMVGEELEKCEEPLYTTTDLPIC